MDDQVKMSRRKMLASLGAAAGATAMLYTVSQGTAFGKEKNPVVEAVYGDKPCITCCDIGADITEMPDASAYLNNKINEVSSSGGGEICLPPGLITVKSMIVLKSGVKLKGQGDATVIKGVFDVPTNRIITSPYDALQTDIGLSDFCVDRSGANAQHGIILGGIHHLRISRVTVRGKSSAESGALGVSVFNAYATIQSQDVIVEGCRIEQSNNFGIAFGNVKEGTIANNVFIDCYRECIGLEAWGDGTPAYLNTHGIVENVTVVGNTVHASENPANHIGGSVGPAVYVGGASGGTVRNCVVTGNTIRVSDNVSANYYGITVTGAPTKPCEGITISDNSVYNASGAGIYAGVLGCITRQLKISGNMIMNPGVSGSKAAILLRNVTDSVVSDNKVIGTTHSYAFEEQVGCDRNMVTTNHFAPGTLGVVNLAGANSSYFSSSHFTTYGGKKFMESYLVADDASIVLKSRGNPQRGIFMIASDYGGNYAIIVANGAGAPIVISKSADTQVGATNPDVDGALNIYPNNAAELVVKNRLGSARNITIDSLTK
ncbi:MAG: Pectate lyase superfamily protein [Paenibacillus sp.]|nr:Pectate lyase superfamily protein [Paenibacillus sp.]